MLGKNNPHRKAAAANVDPKNPNTGEIVNEEEEKVVNTEEQENVLNEQDTSTAPSKSEEKRKGYEEGLRNDSMNEPEFKDSDDQLEFPDEEGKQ